MRHRLSRLDQIYLESPLYFLTFCTHERKPLLANPSLHHSFQTFARESSSRGIFVGRYILMPDHVHFFTAFAVPDEMSMWIKSLKNALSKTLRENNISSPHWQKGYFDHLLRNEGSYESKWHYVRENPVRKALVAETEDWAYQGEIEPLGFD